MTFVKHNEKNGVNIPPAVLKLAKLPEAGKMELTVGNGAVILTSGSMTAKELIDTVHSLRTFAANLTDVLMDDCGGCEDCDEGACVFRDMSMEALTRPAVTVPDWAREEADIPKDTKLDCHVEEDSGEIIVSEALYDYDLSDVPPKLLQSLRESGCCMADLEDALMENDVIYEK